MTSLVAGVGVTVPFRTVYRGALWMLAVLLFSVGLNAALWREVNSAPSVCSVHAARGMIETGQYGLHTAQ